MDYEILAKNALHFPRLLESPESFISFCEDKASAVGIKIEPWLSGGDVDPHHYGDMWLLRRSSDSNLVQELLDTYDKAILLACREFLNYLEVDQDLVDATIESLKNNRMPAMTVKRYFEGEALGPHPDIDPSNTEDVLHLTVSMYYNDDYVGGDIGLVGGSATKPTPGSVVVFPSKYLHESTLITSGIKYVSNEVVKLDSRFIERA
jgi:hypothetical protein